MVFISFRYAERYLRRSIKEAASAVDGGRASERGWIVWGSAEQWQRIKEMFAFTRPILISVIILPFSTLGSGSVIHFNLMILMRQRKSVTIEKKLFCIQPSFSSFPLNCTQPNHDMERRRIQTKTTVIY